MKTEHLKGLAAFSFLCFVWGSTWAVSSEGLTYLPAMTLAYLRNGMAGSLLVAYFLLRGYALPRRSQWPRLLLQAILLFALNTGLSFWSLNYIPGHTAAVIGCMSPLFIYWMQRATGRITRHQGFMAGFLVSFTGIGLLVWNGAALPAKGYTTGIIFSLLAVLAWSIGIVLMQKDEEETDLYYGFGWQLLISAAILYLVAAGTHTTVALSDINQHGWLTIIYLAVFGSVLAFLALGYMVRRLPAAVHTLYVFVNPVVAAGISVLAFEESVQVAEIVGGLLVLLGIWLVVRKLLPFRKQTFQKRP